VGIKARPRANVPDIIKVSDGVQPAAGSRRGVPRSVLQKVPLARHGGRVPRAGFAAMTLRPVSLFRILKIFSHANRISERAAAYSRIEEIIKSALSPRAYFVSARDNPVSSP